MSKLQNTTRTEAAAHKRRTTKKTTAKAAFEAFSGGFADDARVEQLRMFGSPCLKVAGRVFAALVNDHLIVKLPKSRVDRWVAADRGTRFDPGHGRIMKEWLSVPAAANRQWAKLAQEALEFVAGQSSLKQGKRAHPRRPRS